MRLRNRLGTLAVAATMAVSGVLVSGVIAPTKAHASPEQPVNGGQAGKEWLGTQDAPTKYPWTIGQNINFRASDGVILKGVLYRPVDLQGRVIQKKMPTIVAVNPYTHLGPAGADIVSIPAIADALINVFSRFNLTGTPLHGITDLTQAGGSGIGSALFVDRKLVQSGYTQLIMDTRGTGWSQGTWQVFAQREQQDNTELINWVAKQPWNNGVVGQNGASASGINQFTASANNTNPALKASFAIIPGGDLIQDVVAPGGGIGITFAPLWAFLVNVIKWLPDLNLLARGQIDWKWLSDRVSSPLTFMDLILQALTTLDLNKIPPNLKALLNPTSTIRKGLNGPNPAKITVPTFIIGGWYDLFANSEPNFFNRISLPTTEKKLIMGNWYHAATGGMGASDGAPPRVDVLQRAWFDHFLKGVNNGVENYTPVAAFEQGGGWVASPTYPVAGTKYQRMYLNAQNSRTAPGSVYAGTLSAINDTKRKRLYVSPGITSVCSRDTSEALAGITSIIGPCTDDNRIAEMNMLTFTGQPVTQPTHISGYSNLHLNVVLEGRAGYFNYSITDVYPDGRSSPIASGQLEASLRKVDEAKSTRGANGDLEMTQYVLTLDDLELVTPGKAFTMDVGSSPTGAVLAPGHRLRIAIGASNLPKSLPIPALIVQSGLKPVSVMLDKNSPSFINIGLSTAMR